MPETASVTTAAVAVDISEVSAENAHQNTDETLDKEAAKKKEANRKKREKAKAKKAAATGEEDGALSGTGRWAKGKLPGGRAERRDAGDGRGLGVYANEAIAKDACIACCKPALSVVFDKSADNVCGFCFKAPKKDATTDHAVELTSAEGSGFGIQLDNLKGAATPTTLVTKVTHESPNRGVVQIGDQFVSVDGIPVDGGYDKAVPMLQAAVKAHGGKAPCVVRRPALLVCPGCKKFAACASCVGEGHMRWHSYECGMLNTLAGIEKAGESSTVRMLLRYRLSTEPKVGEWCDDKEPVGLLTSLQANAAEVPAQQLANLAKVSSLPAADVAKLIGQVRTNACEVSRNGCKAGMALSVLTGWHNHDCLPNAQSLVDADGKVGVHALRDIEEGEEIKISYIDATQDYDVRRKTLKEHYGFECTCGRCAMEEKAFLKKQMNEKRQYLAGQRR